MNSFGHNFRISLFGESHGEAVGVVIDGIKAGMALSADDFEADLARRRGGASGTTPRRESDCARIVSGLYKGHTTGAPLAILFDNSNTRSSDYSQFAAQPRPSHADWTGMKKFDGYNDPRGGGHFSGRLTLAIVAAGTVAKKMLPEVKFATAIVSIGRETDRAKFQEVIDSAKKTGDSVGGVVECRIQGVGAGLGEPFFDSIESLASHLLFAIPAVKGVEFGAGFEAAHSMGSRNNDAIIDADGHTATNNEGGINGGISNGNEIVVRAAIKPTASIAAEQQCYNFATGQIEPLRITGRHDCCIAIRAAVVVEAAMAIVLADLSLQRQNV